MRSFRLRLAGCLAGVLLGLATGVAGADTLELPLGERGFRVQWAPLEIVAPLTTLRCNVTLEGSFHSRTNAKVGGSLIGHVTSAAISGCAGTVLTETLPWHVTYDSFAGTLPSITSISLSVTGVSVSAREPFGATCLLRSSGTNPVRLIGDTAPWEEELELEGTGFIVPTVRAEESSTIPLTGGGFCASAEASLRGSGATTVAGGTRRIRVGLTGVTASADNEIEPEESEENNRIRARIRNLARAGGPRIRIMTISLGGRNPERYAIEDPNSCEGRNLAPGHLCRYFVERFEAGGEAEVRVSSSVGPLRPWTVR